MSLTNAGGAEEKDVVLEEVTRTTLASKATRTREAYLVEVVTQSDRKNLFSLILLYDKPVEVRVNILGPKREIERWRRLTLWRSGLS